MFKKYRVFLSRILERIGKELKKGLPHIPMH